MEQGLHPSRPLPASARRGSCSRASNHCSPCLLGCFCKAHVEDCSMGLHSRRMLQTLLSCFSKWLHQWLHHCKWVGLDQSPCRESLYSQCTRFPRPDIKTLAPQRPQAGAQSVSCSAYAGPCAGALDFKFVEALTEQAKQAALHIAALIKSIEP